MHPVSHIYKVGDWVLWIGKAEDGFPIPGTVHHVVALKPGGSVYVAWAGTRWPMFSGEIRPATQEEISRGQLASLEGL